MDYRIELEEFASDRIVHTSVSGLMSDKDRDRVALETIRTMREHGVSRAIWDIREAELDYSLLGSHLVVTNLAALGVNEADRIAVVYAEESRATRACEAGCDEQGDHRAGLFPNAGGSLQVADGEDLMGAGSGTAGAERA